MVGQVLRIANHDAALHNPHLRAVRNIEFNKALPSTAAPFEYVFERREIVRIVCDIHGWMHCHVHVLTHPFVAVSSNDGSYRIDGLPPSSYSLELWHETLGRKTVEVVVRSGEVTTQCFRLAKE
jgi:hypothetical protein